MKRSEIEKIADIYCIEQTRLGESHDFNSYIDGYTQGREDMDQEIFEFGKLVLDTFHSEGKTSSGEERLPRIKFDEWFKSLKNK